LARRANNTGEHLLGVQARMFQRFEHVIGPQREHTRAAAARDVAEGVREKGFAHTDGADDRDMRMGVEKA
jgi:hypothetical protein